MMEGFNFHTDGTVWVIDTLWWPTWHKDLVTFLPSQQKLFHNFDIATVIEQAKQKHVDRFCTSSELTSLVWYRNLQPDYQYAEYLSTVKCFSNRRLLSRFRCGCHGLHVDTGRWVGTERKDRLCQVCHSSQDVEDEQQFIFDCSAYSHIRTKHASIFQQTRTVPDFIARCESNAWGGFLRECFSLEEVFSDWIVGSVFCLTELYLTELICTLSVGPQLVPRTLNRNNTIWTVTSKARLSLAMHSYLQANVSVPWKRVGFRCSQHLQLLVSNMETSRIKSRDDIMALMHVVYTGNDAYITRHWAVGSLADVLMIWNDPQDAKHMPQSCFWVEVIWTRKHNELLEKLEDNTKKSFCTAIWKWLVIMIADCCMFMQNSNQWTFQERDPHLIC